MLTICIEGRTGEGKTTLAFEVYHLLKEKGFDVEFTDQDQVEEADIKDHKEKIARVKGSPILVESRSLPKEQFTRDYAG